MRLNILFMVVIIFVFALGWFAHDWHYHNSAKVTLKVVKNTAYIYTSPLLDVEFPEGLKVNKEPIPFKGKINDLIIQQTDGVRIRRISVYFRDLMDGPWFCINEGYKYDPASLLKVPVMVAWLKRIEKNPKILSQTFQYDGKSDSTTAQLFKPAKTLIPGQHYSVEELLQYMMKYSDNNSLTILRDNLKLNELIDVHTGMLVPKFERDEDLDQTVKTYSGFFRILYNASFLNREMSEKALQLLSFADFPIGIVAGVPKGTKIASKYGETIRDGHYQLHEFGIVYHPNETYILGIMTEGSDLRHQAEIIKRISELTYNSVSVTSGRN